MRKYIKEANKPLTFNTANVKANALEVAELFCNELTEEIEPYVLDSTPAVLTVGRRCMKQGYSFVWLADRSSYSFTPSGKIVELDR